MDCDKKRLQCHAVVFSQVFSPCGDVLVTGDNFGRLGIFTLRDLHSCAANLSSVTRSDYPSKLTVTVCDGSIYSLHTIGDLLVCGTTCGIKAFTWSAVLALAEAPTVDDAKLDEMFVLDPPSDVGGGRIVNGLCTMGDHLVSASATGCVQIWDVEHQRLVMKFTGHSKQALCVVSRPHTSHQCFSGSDDGTVKLWDSRSANCSHSLSPGVQTPGKNSSGWVSAVAVDPNDRWLVCGGSMPLSLHHISMLSGSAGSQTASPPLDSASVASPSTAMTTSSSVPASTLAPLASHQATTYGSVATGTTNSCVFSGSSLLSAGSTSRLYHWDLGGSLQKEVPCWSRVLYSVAVNGDDRDKVISVAGSSAFIDVFTGYLYGSVRLVLT